MKTVVHIINADRFTAGYINFMKIEMPQYDHHFFFLNSYGNFDLIDNINVYPIKKYDEVVKSFSIRKLLYRADKIVISGVFNVDIYYSMLPNKILNKTYLHFWGGDFYQFDAELNVKKRAHKCIMRKLIVKSKGCIFLIDGDANKFSDIFNVQKETYVAKMPDDPRQKTNYDEILVNNKEHKHRVIVGNSATRTNNHHEVFQYLKKYLNLYDDFEIICPLSYGDEQYRNEIIRIGENIFGNSFVPILQSMDYTEYASLLATCSSGIFDNNRQQGMGNISLLLYLGKKVYIREDTAMWDTYSERGFHVYSFNELINSDNLSLFDIDEYECKHNILVRREYLKNLEQNYIYQWKTVLNL